MVRIAIVGLGPVGLATAISFAMEDHTVVGIGVDGDRLSHISRGEPPFFEVGL